MGSPLSTNDVIAKLGGRVKAAEVCGVTVWATYKWNTNGIPSRLWSRIKERTGLSLDRLAASVPRKQKRA